MGLLNKIYGLVQAGRCLFYIFYDDKFEQLKADRRVFRKFEDDGEVEMVVFMHGTTSLLTPKRRWKGSSLSLEKNFK